MNEDTSTDTSVSSSLQIIVQAISDLSAVLREHKEEFLLVTVSSTWRAFYTGSVLGKDYLKLNQQVVVNFQQHCAKDGDAQMMMKTKCTCEVSTLPETMNSEIGDVQSLSTVCVHCVQRKLTGTTQGNESVELNCEHDNNVMKVKSIADSVTQSTTTTTDDTANKLSSVSQTETTTKTFVEYKLSTAVQRLPSITQPPTSATSNTVERLSSVTQHPTSATSNTVERLSSVTQHPTCATSNTVETLSSITQHPISATSNTVERLSSVTQHPTCATSNTVERLSSVTQPPTSATSNTVETLSSVTQPPTSATSNTVETLSSVTQPPTSATSNTVERLSSVTQPPTSATSSTVDKISSITEPLVTTTDNTIEKLSGITQPQTSTTKKKFRQPSSFTQPLASKTSNTVHKLARLRQLLAKQCSSEEHTRILSKYNVEERRGRCIYVPQSVTEEAEGTKDAFSHILNSADSTSMFGDLSGLIKVKSLKSLILERRYMDDWIIGDIDDQEIDLEDTIDEDEFRYEIVNCHKGSMSDNNRSVTSSEKNLAPLSWSSAVPSKEKKSAPDEELNKDSSNSDICQKDVQTSDASKLEFQCLNTYGEEEVSYAEIALDKNIENESVPVCNDNSGDVTKILEIKTENICVENDSETSSKDLCGQTHTVDKNMTLPAFIYKLLVNGTSDTHNTSNIRPQQDSGEVVLHHSKEKPENGNTGDLQSNWEVADLKGSLSCVTVAKENTDNCTSDGTSTGHDIEAVAVVTNESNILQEGNRDNLLKDDVPVPCRHCGVYFPNEYSVQLHIEYNHPLEASSSKLQSCDTPSSDNTALPPPNNQRLAHSQVFRQIRNLGNRAQWHRSTWIGSMRKGRKVDSYDKLPQPCKHCHRRFVNGFGLRTHQRSCKGVSDESKKCKIANSHEKEEEFTDGLQTRCVIPTELTCLICQDVHASVDSIVYHMKTKHGFKLATFNGLVGCSGCEQKFDLPSEAQSHIETENSCQQSHGGSGLKKDIKNETRNKNIHCQDNLDGNKSIKNLATTYCHNNGSLDNIKTLDSSNKKCEFSQQKCFKSEFQQSLKCSECSVTCSSISKLKVHMERTHNVTVSCPVCKKFLVSENNITGASCTCGKTKDNSTAASIGQSRKRKQNFSWKCHFCYQQFSSVTTLKQHLYLCPENDESDTYIDVMDETDSEAVVSNPKFDVLKNRDDENTMGKKRKTALIDNSCKNICEKCGTTYKNEKLLRSHQKHYHASKQLSSEYKCGICGKLFSKEISLNAHMHICSNRSNANSSQVKRSTSKKR